MAEIDRAIEALYDTFARYPRPAAIEHCPCGCTEPGATATLVALPLREIQFSNLEDYSLSAMTTQGSMDDFRYLLPRLFHGIAEESYGYNSEILFGKLAYAKWMSWREDEIAAVRSYLHALWRKGLNSFPLEAYLPAFSEIEILLASIVQTDDALEPYLKIWTEMKTKEADEHLVQFVTMYGAEFSEGRTLHEAFWQDSKPQADALRRWLLRADTLHRISNASYLLRSDGYDHLFGPAFVILQSQSPFC